LERNDRVPFPRLWALSLAIAIRPQTVSIVTRLRE
jgi:hypothetical protein